MVVNMADFKASLSNAAPASDLAPPLAALWWAAKGNWDQAHKIVQDEGDANSAWVHDTCTASKATSAMPATGIGELESRWRKIRCKTNGNGSCQR